MAETEPVEPELIRRAIESRLADLQVSMPGIVQSYDAATQRATVQPALRRPIYDVDDTLTSEDIPPIQNVPVLWPRSANLSMHSNLTQGDSVLLVFQTLSPAEWRSTGAVATPGDLRLHGWYPIAIPGYYADTTPGPDTDESMGPPGDANRRVHWNSDHVAIGKTAADWVAMAAKILDQLNALKSAIDTAAGVESGAAGLGGMNALKAALAAIPGTPPGWPLAAGVASSNLKAEP